MLKQAWHMLKNFREPTAPLTVAVDITSRCNSRCVYCEVWKKKDFSKDLTPEDVDRIVDQAEEAGIRNIILSGGEVTVYRDLFRLLRDLKEREFHVTLLTNALLFKPGVSQEKVDVLNECVNNIQFSLDSADPKRYEELRGVDGVDRVGSALDLITKPKRGLSCVVSSENFWEIDAVVRFGAAHRADFVGFQPLNVATVFFDIPVLEGKSQYLPTEEKFAALQEALTGGLKLARELGVDTNLGQLKTWIEPFFKYSTVKGKDYFFNHVPGLKNFKCAFPSQSVYINAEGEMTPCRLLPSVGNVKGKNFIEEWRHNPGLNEIRNNLKQGIYYEECKTCYCQFPPNLIYSLLLDPIGNYQLLKHILPDAMWRARKFV
jgi:MoaA/NifB/PqqE/SkfB family radical SAM enzyme